MIAAAMRDFDVLGLLIDFGASRARQNNEGMPLEAILQVGYSLNCTLHVARFVFVPK